MDILYAKNDKYFLITFGLCSLLVLYLGYRHGDGYGSKIEKFSNPRAVRKSSQADKTDILRGADQSGPKLLLNLSLCRVPPRSQLFVKLFPQLGFIYLSIIPVYLYLSVSIWVRWRAIETVCPRGSDPFYIVSYYIKRVTFSWTYSTFFSKENFTLLSLLVSYIFC